MTEDEAPEVDEDGVPVDIPPPVDIPEEDAPQRALSTRRSRTARLLEAQRVLELHLAGVEDVYIMAELGISRATLYRRIREATAVVVDPTVAEYRQEAAARLRIGRRKVLEALATEPIIAMLPDGSPVAVPALGPADVATLVTTLIRLEDTEAKLRGGYAPAQVNVRHRVEDALDTLLEELGQRPAPTAEERAR